MRVVVLVKAVPDLDRMPFDPESRTARRAGTELFLNPFDARAVLVAASLAGPDELPDVVSLGPAEARGPLLEAMAMGAARGYLLSDPRFAGSDTLVTARALAAAVRPLAPDLVLAGRWTTDSSTGQVPAELAENLGLPYVDGARRIEPLGSGRLGVVADTDDGWARYEVGLPCVVSVGEKIVKMRAASPEAREAAARRPFSVLTLEDLGLSPGEVGASGSPTRVVRLEDEAPSREPRLFRATVATEVDAATERVRALLARPRPAGPAIRRPTEEPGPEGEVLVFVGRPEGGVDSEALPLVSEVWRLPFPLHPSVVGFGPWTDRDALRLARAGASRAYWSAGPDGWRSPESVSGSVVPLLDAGPTAAGLLVRSTPWGRELAGRLAARRRLGLTGDAVGLALASNGSLVFRKPSFGGRQVADVETRRGPALATVRTGAFAGAEFDREASAFRVALLPPIVAPDRVVRTGTGREHEARYGDLARARTVVVVGMGVGGPEGIAEVLDAIRPLGAALAATRRVVDSGWVPPQLQVGLTGRSVAPDLYLTVGASGKANHLVGAQRARVVVGINSNPDEPLFSRVDVGLVGDWRTVLAPLARALAPAVAPTAG